MGAENDNSKQRRAEAGERYISALEKLDASPKVIEAAKRAIDGPTYDERKKLIAAGKMRRKATFFERLSRPRRSRKIG